MFMTTKSKYNIFIGLIIKFFPGNICQLYIEPKYCALSINELQKAT